MCFWIIGHVPLPFNIYIDSLKSISSTFPIVSWDLVSFSPHWITWKLRTIHCFVFHPCWFMLPLRTCHIFHLDSKTDSKNWIMYLFLFSKYLAQYLTQKIFNMYLSCTSIVGIKELIISQRRHSLKNFWRGVWYMFTNNLREMNTKYESSGSQSTKG